MSMTHTLAIVTLGFALSTQSLEAQARSRYRDFQLGSDLQSVSVLAKVAATDAKTIHQRPAVMQELEWRRPYYVSGSTGPQTDSIERIVFSFYNDQLFRLVITYDRLRTDGMTSGDMIEALSQTYGSALKSVRAKAPAAVSPIEAESGEAIAQWAEGDSSLVLYRSSYGSEFRIIMTSPRLEALARTAAAQAIRLDEREAPQREMARQKKDAEDTRESQDKARVANKATFRP
jgi:hypothetical protein